MLSLQIQPLNSTQYYHIDLHESDITIEIVGVIMNEDKGGTYSYPFTVDVDENLHVFGSSAELRGDRIYSILHGAKARLMANGLPVIQGKIDLDTSVDIKNDADGHRKVELKVISRNKSFDERIDGAKVRDLDFLQHKIEIGRSIDEKLYFTAEYRRRSWKYIGTEEFNPTANYALYPTEYPDLMQDLGTEQFNKTRYVSLPHFMFANYIDYQYKGEYSKDCTNVTNEYDPSDPLKFPFCNTRICFQNYKVDEENSKDKEIWKEERGYKWEEADRINSAPCFYLGFVFDMAMQQLHIPVTHNAANDIMDYRRMAYWHADARYKEKPVLLPQRGTTPPQQAVFCEWGWEWKWAIPVGESKSYRKFGIEAKYLAGQQHHGNNRYVAYVGNDVYVNIYDFKNSTGDDAKFIRPKYGISHAYATADNLPDIEVKDVIESITSTFGGRVIYDEYLGTMKIILLRDVMRNSANAIDVPCEITDVYKTENDNRGFRLKYASSNTQSFNSITKVKNETKGSDETAYNYHGYKNVQMLDDSSESEYHSYQDLVMGVSCYDENLYVDTNTGNAFRVKVDSQADTQGAWHPSTFEVNGYRDVELGDCSDEDFVKTVTIPFAPAISTMVNQEQMRIAHMKSEDLPSPLYAQYVDGEIHYTGELLEHNYVYDNIPLETITDEKGKEVIAVHIDVNVKVQAIELYGDAPDAPYYDKECENVIGIMRGSGSGASLVYYDQNCDGFGTCRYMNTAGSDAEFFSDSVNHFGEMFDYNGGGATLVKYDQAAPLIHSYFGGNGEDYAKLYNVEFAAAWNIAEKAWCIHEIGSGKIVGKYTTKDAANEYLQLLLDLRSIIFTPKTEATVYIPDNGLGYLPQDAISLKLKAEKPIEGDKDKGYYPINPTFAKRGLWDKYYVDWAYFWLNHKIANISAIIEQATLAQLAQDTTQWYTFGEYRGLIKSATAHLLPNSLVQLDLKLAYI